MTDESPSAAEVVEVPEDEDGPPYPLAIGRRSGLAAAVYGEIVALSVVAALEIHEQVAAWELLLAVIGNVIVFWLAHVYAESVAVGLDGPHLRHLLREEAPMVMAGGPVVIALALGAVGLISRSASVALAVAVGSVTLLMLATIAARVSGQRPARAAITAAVGGVIGLVFVLLKALLH